MSIYLLSIAVVALVSAVGGVVTVLIAGIPLRILARAAVGGRFAGLAAGDRGDGITPSSGRRVGSLAAVGVAAA